MSAAPRTVLLVGTYGLQRRKSVELFGEALAARLPAHGWEVRHAPACGALGALAHRRGSKPLALLDRLLLQRSALLTAGRRAGLVHFTDTSDAVLLNGWFGSRTVVTCHDLFFLERTLGTGRASRSQRLWQGAIRRGLDRADAVGFVSHCSAAAFRRVSRRAPQAARDRVIPNGPYQDFHAPPAAETAERLAALAPALAPGRYVLNVGSNFERKNRRGVLRAFAAAGLPPDFRLAMVGERMQAAHRTLAAEHGIADRIVELPEIGFAALEALYAGAFALLFPSFEEGFGVPILEAQQCDCPVVCSDIEIFHEVAERSALLAPPADAAALGASLRQLLDPQRRAALVAAGHANARRYSLDAMARDYAALYAEVLAAPH